MRVTTDHGLHDLARDLGRAPAAMYRGGRKIVTEGARVGATLARGNAKRTAGRHGKRYPSAITSDRASVFFGFGGGEITAAYGPDSSKPQGGMSFEGGSRNQPPHHDLAKSADVIGPAFVGEVRSMLDDIFWPGGDR